MKRKEGAVTGANRVKRGGSWNNNSDNLRSANRNNNTPTNRNNNIGFRLARPEPRSSGLRNKPLPVEKREAVSLAYFHKFECPFSRWYESKGLRKAGKRFSGVNAGAAIMRGEEEAILWQS